MISIDRQIKLLGYIIGSVGVLPLVFHIPVLSTVATILLGLIALWIDLKKISHVSRVLLTVVSFIVIGISLVLIIRSGDIVFYAVHGLITLLLVKLFEEKQFRDYMQIIAITLFLMAASSLYSLSMWFLVYIFIALFLIIIQIVLLTFYIEDQQVVVKKEDYQRLILTSLPMPVIAIPVAIFIFFILPRTDYPLFNKLNKQQSSTVGFSDEVELGSVSSIQQNNSVAFRVQMDEIAAKDLYWRGIVLDTYEDQIWKASDNIKKSDHFPVSELSTYGSDQKLQYEVFMEPNGDRYLYSLDLPVRFEGLRYRRKGGFVFTVRHPIFKRTRYTGFSVVDASIEDPDDNILRYRQLPNQSSAIVQLADSLKGESAEQTAKQTLAYFLDDTFTYATSGLTVSDTPLETFLFESKLGNCEFYASAFAVLLRQNDIPARLVGGFRGGHYNETLGYYKVPSNNAHVWVEVWIDGVWKRYDPTPADLNVFMRPVGTDLKTMVTQFSDAMTYYWNTLVITYDFAKQVDIARGIGDRLKKLLDGWWIAVMVAGFGGIYVLFRFLPPIHFRKKGQEERLIYQFEQVLATEGWERKEGEGLEMLVRKVTDKEVSSVAMEFVNCFHSSYYTDKPLTETDIKRFQYLLDKLKDVIKKRLEIT